MLKGSMKQYRRMYKQEEESRTASFRAFQFEGLGAAQESTLRKPHCLSLVLSKQNDTPAPYATLRIESIDSKTINKIHHYPLRLGKRGLFLSGQRDREKTIINYDIYRKMDSLLQTQQPGFSLTKRDQNCISLNIQKARTGFRKRMKRQRPNVLPLVAERKCLVVQNRSKQPFAKKREIMEVSPWITDSIEFK